MTLNTKYRQMIVLALFLQGCAIGQKDNRVLLNALDKSVADTAFTRNPWARGAAIPVVAPLGIAAGVVDVALITPARALAPAWEDTSSFLWENPQGSELRQMTLLLPKAVATPVLFGSDWAFRSLLGYVKTKGGDK